jgi:hypothetical protein
MNLCYPNKSVLSCGSCCGIFNLNLNKKELTFLLFQRTEEFNDTVDFKIQHTIPAYRQSRERKEESITKRDETTYNCPFLGYLESHSKIGCMIHPNRTNDPLSQNYSFYGSSICQGYQCKNRENPYSPQWSQLFQEIAVNSIEYSQMSADHQLIRVMESFFLKAKIEIQSLFHEHREKIKILITEYSKAHGFNKQLTSFEIGSGIGDLEEGFLEKLSKLLDKNSPSLAWLESLII